MNLLWLKLTIVYSIIMLTAKAEDMNKSATDLQGKVDNFEESRKIRRILPGETLSGLTDCDSFEIGNEELKEFYSPNYPLNYKNNTTCIRTISAPSANQQIVLDFRGTFNLERSEGCKYDYLEVRDGRFGYSRLIDSYCGHSFPEKEITSSGPHMWLKFHSDDHIEYGGFRAVYRFIDKQNITGQIEEDEPCFVNITALESEYISHENISQEIWNRSVITGLECMYVINVTTTKKVSLQWDFFSLQYPNDCVKNKIDVFDKKSDTELNSFCGAAAEPVISEDHIMRVRLVAGKNITIKFKAHFTAFRSDQNCSDREFNCQDGTCIDLDLQCNNMVNCRTGSDEDEEDCREEPTLWEHLTEGDIMIILVIFFATIFGMCCTLLFNIVRKLIHDYRVIKENIAHSRESQLDQLGRKTPTMTILTPMATIVPNFPNNIVHAADISATESGQSSTVLRHQSLSDDCYVPTDDTTFPNIVRREMYDGVNGGPAFRMSTLRPMQQQQQSHRQQRNIVREEDENNVDDDDDDDGGFVAAAAAAAGAASSNRTNPDGSDPTTGFTPEMIDTECQTRESLFQNTSPFSSFINNSSNRSSSGGSPSLSASTYPSKSMMITMSAHPIGFTTFGKKNHQKPPDKPLSSESSSSYAKEQQQQQQKQRRFKAEAIIELNNKHKVTPQPESAEANNVSGNDRVYSFQSTKSAPDVIVTH